MNRFFDIDGDCSRQLAPWEMRRRGLPAVVAQFELLAPIRFRSDIAGGIITVPVGFLSDLASIPQFAWSIFMASDDPRIELGAWIHDRLYSLKGDYLRCSDAPPIRPNLTRQECDAILAFEAMPELGATAFQQQAVYRALRVFGDRW